MAAGQVVGSPIRQLNTATLAIVGATLAIGIAIGAGAEWVAGSIGSQPAASSAAFAVTPTLDTSKPYLTIQNGVVVPPAWTVTPTLDTSKPYLTIQNGVVVPPAWTVTPTLDTSKPYLTIQGGVVVPPATK